MDAHTEIGQLAAEQRLDDRSTTAGDGRQRIGRTWVEHADSMDLADLENTAMPADAASASGADRLKAAIDNLPERQRDVINLLFWERVTEREAAERLGISRRAVQTHRSRALARLREMVGEAVPSALAEAS